MTALIEELTQKEARRIEPNRVANDDGGPDDDAQPLNEMEQAIASNRNRNDAVQLQRLQAAMARLKENPDEFGLCLECEEDIPFPRLKAMPYAEYCVGCQTKQDGQKIGHTRKKLTDYV